MKRIILVFAVALSLQACRASLTTRAQRAHYEDCRKVLVGHKVALRELLKDNDTASQFINDIINLNLNGMVKKYGIQKEEIDQSVEIICMTADIFRLMDASKTSQVHNR